MDFIYHMLFLYISNLLTYFSSIFKDILIQFQKHIIMAPEGGYVTGCTKSNNLEKLKGSYIKC